MFSRRPVVTGAIGIEFRDQSQSAGLEQTRSVAQDSGWIVGVMQDHGDQSRIDVDAGQFERRRIGNVRFDVRDAALLLQAIQIGERVGRWIDGKTRPKGPTRAASRKLTKPGPGPTSKTRSPGFSRSASIQSSTRGARCTWRS